MTLIESLISGIVQGFTEFLPISSSAHLVLVHNLLGISESDIFFDVCLHAATLAAVIVYFRKDIISIMRPGNSRMLNFICLGTVPAAAAALFFEEKISSFFTSPGKVGAMLMVTAIMLFLGQAALRKGEKQDKVTLRSAFLVGLSQACALLPGISRSGVTISTGLMAGMKAEEAFKFSFLLSIPAILGAVIYKIVTTGGETAASMLMSPNYICGMSVAFLTGLAGLNVLRYVIASRKLHFFGLYCLVLGSTLVIIFAR